MRNPEGKYYWQELPSEIQSEYFDKLVRIVQKIDGVGYDEAWEIADDYINTHNFLQNTEDWYDLIVSYE